MSKMELESNIGRMEHTFEGISPRAIKNLGSLSGQTKLRTLVSLSITSFKERANLCGRIRDIMMVHGRITLCMGVVPSFGRTDKSLKEYMKIRRKTDLVS